MNNNIKFLIIGILTFLNSCCCEITEPEYTTSATIYLINETNVIVESETNLELVIHPGDTVIYNETFTSNYKEMPSLNDYDPFPTYYIFFYRDGNNKCETGLRHLENYENGKEIEPLVFELTFRFTEERRAGAELCKLRPPTRVDFVFDNQTDNTVKFETYDEDFSSFIEIIISPQSTSDILSYNYFDAGKNPDIESCCQLFLERLGPSQGRLYEINGDLCVRHQGELSDLILNYNAEAISAWHFRYTYTFTDKDFVNAERCE